MKKGGVTRAWSPESRQCQKQHPGGSLGIAPQRQEEEEGQVAVLGVAVAAAAVEAARLDGAALEETAGTHTKQRIQSFQEEK